MSIDPTATLAVADPEIAAQVENEVLRQHEGLEMIASENFVSPAVLENLARDRAKKLFNAEHANVQPSSGSQANAAAYMAIINPGDTVLGLDLAHGGHLTHGHKLNFSGKLYRIVGYQVRKDTETIDYDELEATAQREKPKVIVGGGSAYPRQFDFPRMRAIADKVGAYLMVDMAHFAGLVAGGVYPSPVAHAHIVTTTTHKTLRGPRGGLIAAKAVALGESLQPAFRRYAAAVVHNAKVLAATLVEAGLEIVSGGTDSH